jgi:YHS domain-containing protein
MQTRRAFLALIAASFSAAVLAQAARGGRNPPLAIKGYDPVAYFVENRAVQGAASFAYDFDDSRYHFASAKNRDAFAANPERYTPQFGGLCTAGLADGRVVESDPTAFVVSDGKLYLFSAAKGVDRVRNDPSLLTKAHQRPAK